MSERLLGASGTRGLPCRGEQITVYWPKRRLKNNFSVLAEDSMY
jgi:hypothetical protein